MKVIAWTEDRIEAMTTMYLAGRSASQIAVEMGGTTRNAVIGKVHRLGLVRAGVAREPKPKVKPIDHRRDRVRGPRPPVHFAPGPMHERPQPIVVGIPEPQSERKAITDLGRFECRFPTSKDDEPHAFCGHRTAGGSYCAYHAARAFAPREPRMQRRAA